MFSKPLPTELHVFRCVALLAGLHTFYLGEIGMETFKEILITLLGYLGAGFAIYVLAVVSESFGLTVKEGFGILALTVAIVCMFKE